MGLRDRMAEVGRKASSAAKGVAGSVGDLGTAMKASLAGVPRPTSPLTAPWEVSIATLLRGERDMPRAAAKALGLLERFGAVRLSGDSIGFDEEDVPWRNVVEVRTVHVLDHVSGRAVEREVERIRKLLPPFPGRKWVVTRAAKCIMTFAVGAIQKAIKDGPAARPVPVAITYKGSLGRKKELVAGMLSTAFVVTLPGVTDAILSTAEAKGITVRHPAGAPATSAADAQRELDEVLPSLESSAAGAGAGAVASDDEDVG